MRLALVASVIALVAVCAACGGGGGGGVTTALATPTPCPLAAAVCAGIIAATTAAGVTPTPVACPSVDPQLVLASPSNGAAGVSDTLSSVLFIYGPVALPSLNSWGSLSLNGVAEGTVGPPPSPLPSAIPTLGPGQAYLAASVITPLSPKTMYQLSVSFTNGCGQAASESAGTFTTQ
jgi:hypothetical protein